MKTNFRGLLRCARYAYGPNNLSYCGPDKTRLLQAYLHENVADQGLAEIINQFETLYPYLSLIATENKITNIFDQRVIEAYWLGNSLLEKTKYRPFAQHLTDTLQLKKKLARKDLSRLLGRLNIALPHHTFHVLNIFRRTGHHAQPHTLSTMDKCRISWGDIVHRSKFKDHRVYKKDYLINKSVFVRTRPLVYDREKLALGKPVIKAVECLFDSYREGDWVTIHWGQVCEKITAMQKQKLEWYTKQAIMLANRNNN